MLNSSKLGPLTTVAVLAASIWSPLLTRAADVYVSEKGDDANPGTSVDNPLRTLQKADGLVKPGDTVWIMNGIYRNENPDATKNGTALLNVKSSGTPDAPITWRAYKDHRPELQARGCWDAIRLNASYLVFDGLTLTGNNDFVRHADAEDNAEVDAVAMAAGVGEGKLNDGASPTISATGKPAVQTPVPSRPRPKGIQSPNPLYNGNGITVDNRAAKGPDFFHHFTFRNLVVRRFGGAGISMIATDYYTIENCDIYDNMWYSRYGGSGISQLGGRNADEAPCYHNIIRNNRVWRNKCLVRCTMVDRYSDGNGIILDSLNGFKGGILIENNLVFDNGGGGIHIFKSNTAKIDVFNNTVWRNQQTWQLYDMGAHVAKNVRFMNNIVVGDRAKRVVGDTALEGVQYDYNIYYGGLKVEKVGPNDLQADPMFVVPATNPKQADFRLRAGSPAIGSASAEVASMTGAANTASPVGTPRNRGSNLTFENSPVGPSAAVGGQ